MGNRTILLAFLVAWAVSMLATYFWAWRKQLPAVGVLASHFIPSAVAIVMTYVFLISGGATVAQFVAGSEAGMDLWSLWFELWPVFLFATATSGFVNLIWTVIGCVRKSQRQWIPITIIALIMSVFAFFTVAANFPDA